MGSEHVPLLAVALPLAAVVGLFVGSFLNVVIYRAPLGLSVSTPRSFCPTCQRQLHWWENVPLV
jgi:leader peptidase (prepilin peptidase)/N-methyltransferase